MRNLTQIVLAGAVAIAASSVWLPPGAARQSQAPPAQGGTIFDAEALAGCYELKFSPWTHSSKHGKFEGWGPLLSKIQLTTDQTPRPVDPVGFVALSLDKPPTDPTGFHYWNLKGPTTIEFHWGNGHSGWEMELDASSDAIHGKAWTFWDFTAPIQTANVTATKFPCPASAK
jgi:hypothetical protein